MIHVGPPGKHDSAFGSPRFHLAVCLLAIGSAAEAFAGIIVVTSSSETVQFQQMQITPSISSRRKPSSSTRPRVCSSPQAIPFLCWAKWSPLARRPTPVPQVPLRTS